MTHSLCDSASVSPLSSAAHPMWNVQGEPFGKLHKLYLLWYIVVAELIGRDENFSLFFCQTAERRVRRELCIS